MTIRRRSFWMLLSFLFSFGTAVAQEAIENWPAPPSWSPPARVISKGEVTPSEVEAVEAVPTPPLHFVGITPCRLVDTRGNGFTGAYGPPSLPQGAPRNFVLTGRCGISATAQAVSLNVTVTNTQGPGFILIYPTGAAQPTVSTLNYVAGQTVANAAVVPLGTGGAITVVAGVSGTDLILDTNGDYRGGVVTDLNGMTGSVNLISSTNSILINPDTDGLNIDVNGGESRLLPPGNLYQTLRHDGTHWVASSTLKNFGSSIEIDGPLGFTQNSASMFHNGNRFLYSTRTASDANTFLGVGAAGAGIPGGEGNIGIGYLALYQPVAGSQGNIGIGKQALFTLSTGTGNIAIGASVGSQVTTGSNNLYIASAPAGNESNQIRIGRSDVHTQGTVIASIYGFGSGSGIPVIVNAGGRLGTTTSSARFKEDVRTIDSESDGLMKLRPVAFRYKESHEPGRLPQYGLIAEEVANVYPELVVNDDEGRPFAIRSQLLDPLLLNEVQKQHRSIETQEMTICEQTRLIERQQAQIDELRATLAKIEAEMANK